ncbi:MAG: DNA polymerase III subunit delta' [Alphaproteobacteria bacterium]|nr:DNA polymerase III subunit delta' [Alphaproteobacteria bacterium]
MTGSAERPAPRQTTALLGHDAAERVFFDTWNTGRMHHAWLLAGSHGIGKATLAFRVARFVLAQGEAVGTGLFDGSPPLSDGLAIPGDHRVSRQVASGGHPDLLTVERSVNPQTGRLRGEIVVDDVRRLSSFLGLTTAAGAWRVVVVDVADEMNRNAANALLKRLEEPPPRTLFLLVSHRPGRLLPTIRSRCRMLNLSALSEDHVVALLSNLAPDLSGKDAAAVARLADGSIGRAVALADTGGLALYRELVGLLAQGSGLDIRAVHALAGRVGRAGAEESFDLLGQLIDRWLSGMILGPARGAMPPDVVAGEGVAAQALRARGKLADWLEVWEKMARLFSQAGRASLDRKQVVINAFLTLRAAARG